MPPRHCCCVGCRIGDDNFNRANSSDPGTKWRILSGTGSIASNRIVVNGQVATTYCHPSAYPLGSYVAEMLLVGISDASVSAWEVWIGDPTTPSYKIDVSHNSGTNQATLTVRDGAGVLIHAETYYGVTTNQTLKICYAPGLMISAFFGGFIPHIDECDATTNARCYVIAGGGDVGGFSLVAGTFDDWIYDVHYIENQTCASCSCFCWKSKLDYSCLPKTLTLTFESVGAIASTFPDIVLYQSFGSPSTVWPNKEEHWNSNVYSCGMPVGAQFAFRFECGRPVNSMALTPLSKDYNTTLGGNITWSWTSGTLPTNSARTAILDSSTCNPLSIQFPEIKINSAFPGSGCSFATYPSGGYQPYCGPLSGTCFASPPDLRFIPRIVV